MINWWLITYLVLTTLGQLTCLVSNKYEPWLRVSVVTVVVGLMYMAGIYTELWSVYK